jgi:hypothetical protein
MCQPLSIRRLSSFYQALYRDVKGSISVEGSLVFPVILIMTIGMLFFSVLVYEQAGVYTLASTAAERTAFAWDNSRKDMVTGYFTPGTNDGLYWRMLDDSALDLLKIGSVRKTSTVMFDKRSAHSLDLELPQIKLRKIERFLPSILTGQATYTNYWMDRRVKVRLERRLRFPGVIGNVLNRGITRAEAAAVVTDPVEFIRTVDFIRTYIPMIKGKISPAELEKAVDLIRNNIKSASAEQNLSFKSHEEARKYLQKLVLGHLSSKSTPLTGKYRVIDALDGEGMVHQAYLGFKTFNQDMKKQMKKDIEMLEKGLVNGVVWHFFRRRSDGRIGPSANLRERLENNGIMLIIHDQ